MIKNANTGYAVLKDCRRNKSTGFTHEERDALGLTGLLPYKVIPMELQVERTLKNLRKKGADIDKYIFLNALQERNERLYYRVVMENVEEMMPIIYTPTVGQACREYAHNFRAAKGFYVTPRDRGNVRQILNNWPSDDVRMIVITDGERILGLGDLGANGMGIPIGKLALYSACAGINPSQCLPITLDVGTNNEDLLNDPLYMGYPHRRLEGEAYQSLMEETIMAIVDRYPKALIQFEDFMTNNAYKQLAIYRDRVLSFNDDIQGTAAVVVAGIFATTRIIGVKFTDLKIMFLGAGSASTGIGDLVVNAMMDAGLSEEDARGRLWFNDSKGLIVKSRPVLTDHSKPYAHDHPPMAFFEALTTIKPHILIGATGSPNTFTKEVIEAMASMNERPGIFALSNPTSRAECTAEEAYTYSQGKAVFVSGSPFAPVSVHGKTFKPGQGNNAYVFPGIGLGALACEAKKVTDEMLLAAAYTLANMVSEESLAQGTTYPPINTIRNVSLEIATAVAEKAYDQHLATVPRPADLKAYIKGLMYTPNY